MYSRKLSVGTRTSPLAIKQTEEVTSALKRLHPQLDFTICGIDTYGDKDKLTPISEIEGSDFFTREIEIALLKEKIDFAVHSAKDLSDKIPDGLFIAAITQCLDPYDALISNSNLKINELRKGAKIGSSSQRRKMQLKKYRPDFQIIDIRGTIGERLEKLKREGLDAVVVAACALVRLGLEQRITQRLPFEILRPHPLQGGLAVEVKSDNLELIKILSKIDSRY